MLKNQSKNVINCLLCAKPIFNSLRDFGTIYDDDDDDDGGV